MSEWVSESGNQKIQYGRQAAILKVTSLKINRLLSMATINKHMEFEIEIPQQSWLMLRKPCRLQTDGRTDRRTDGQTDKVNPVYPPSNFVGRGYKNVICRMSAHQWFQINLLSLKLCYVVSQAEFVQQLFQWLHIFPIIHFFRSIYLEEKFINPWNLQIATTHTRHGSV